MPGIGDFGGSEFYISVSGDVDKFMRVLARKNKRAMRAGVREVAKMSDRRLRQNIKAGVQGPPISLGTRRKRQMGKLAGEWPEIATYASVKPLYRSGAMMRAIRVKYLGKGMMRYIVHIPLDVVGEYSGGKWLPLSTIAAMQERGYTHTVQMTRKMQVYLMLLYGRISSVRQAAMYKFTPRTLVINVPARPVWGRTWIWALQNAPKKMFTTWIEGLGGK